jgi:hypothetical protein
VGTILNEIDVPKLGIVRGMVVDVNDPLGLCRVKVRVPSIHGMEGSTNYRPDKEIPWAYPSLPANMKQVPKVKDFVWVLFENSRIDMPVYMGIVLGKQTADPSKPVIVGYGSSPTQPTSYKEPVYEGTRDSSTSGTIFSTENFDMSFDEGDAQDGSEGRFGISKDNSSFEIGKNLSRISVGTSIIEATDTAITVSYGENSKVEVNNTATVLSFGANSIILNSAGIILTVGSTSINLSESNINLKATTITQEEG